MKVAMKFYINEGQDGETSVYASHLPIFGFCKYRDEFFGSSVLEDEPHL